MQQLHIDVVSTTPGRGYVSAWVEHLELDQRVVVATRIPWYAGCPHTSPMIARAITEAWSRGGPLAAAGVAEQLTADQLRRHNSFS